jgi:hypothetical protein
MSVRPKVALLVLGLTALIAVYAASPASATTVQVISPFSGFFINSCQGDESIAFDGFLHDVIRVEQDATGGFHIHAVTNGQQLQGIGVTSGDRYRIAAAAHNSVAIRFDPALELFTGTTTQTLKFVSATSSDNLSLVITQHITITPTGDVTAEVTETRSTCDG